MPNELENSLRNAAARVAQYVEDVATMTVQTQYVQVGPNGDLSFDQARPIARTTIKLDGDCDAIVPMREAPAGRPGQMELDAAVLDLHLRNVNAAIDYRARILSALLTALQPRGR